MRGIDTFGQTDLFYQKLNQGLIQWLHYDARQPSIEICTFNQELLQKADAESWEAKEVFDRIRAEGNCTILKAGTAVYESAMLRTGVESPVASGCSYRTLMQLEQLLTARELLNRYCRREMGAPADFSVLYRIELDYREVQIYGRPHILQACADLLIPNITVYLDSEPIGTKHFPSLKDMNEHFLADLTAEKLWCFPEWALAHHVEHQQPPIARIDFLGNDGTVGDWVEYRDEAKFLADLKEENEHGVPLCVVLYRDSGGKTISKAFLQELDPPPKGFSIEDVPDQKPKERNDAR